MTESKATAREVEYYNKLRKTVKVWAGGEGSTTSRYAEYILAAPDLFMLTVGLSRDERVSSKLRTKLAGAVAYFINPFDLMPEAILGPPGLVDDVALSAYVLYELMENTDPTVIREHWQGDADILELIRQTLTVADTMVGGPIWRRLIDRVDGVIFG